MEEDLEADESNFEEIQHNGFPLKWDKSSNFLKDIDDDEVVGRRVKIDGEWQNIMDDEDKEDKEGSSSSSSSSSSSDSSSEDE